MEILSMNHRPKALGLLFAALMLCWTGQASTQPTFEGPAACQECHTAEYDQWSETQHAESFNRVHKRPKAKRYLKAMGGPADARENEVCQACHYTVSKGQGDSAVIARAGPACEHCHGPSSEWITIHRNYGGREVTKRTEPIEHRKNRYQSSKDNGMIWPSMRYDIAEGCYRCHILNPNDLDAETLTKLSDSGHPVDTEFELIEFSQGSVRHRFYPPDIDTNQELSPPDLARFWAVGQAAKLVVATRALARLKHPKYASEQQRRIAEAKEALAIIDIPETRALMDKPTPENGRRFAKALEALDLTETVRDRLPDPEDYR